MPASPAHRPLIASMLDRKIHRRKRRRWSTELRQSRRRGPTSIGFVELETERTRSQVEVEELEPPGNEVSKIDRQGQGRRRARGPQGRGPPPARAEGRRRRPNSIASSAEPDAIHSSDSQPVASRRAGRRGRSAEPRIAPRASTTPPKFDFKPLDHVELAEKLRPDRLRRRAPQSPGTASTSSRTKPCCWSWPCSSYALELLVAEGFTPTITPDLARNEVLRASASFPAGRRRRSTASTNSDLSLVATAEITLGGL